MPGSRKPWWRSVCGESLVLALLALIVKFMLDIGAYRSKSEHEREWPRHVARDHDLYGASRA